MGPCVSEDQDFVSFAQTDERKIGFDYLNRNCPASEWTILDGFPALLAMAFPQRASSSVTHSKAASVRTRSAGE